MFDKRYLQGIAHFNKREFFDAHEVWESLWKEEKGEGRKFLQGLIQYATALHHFERRNFRGARILFDTGSRLLEPYGDVHWGLPVKKLMDDMRVCVSLLLGGHPDQLPGREHPDRDILPSLIKEANIPKIRLHKETGSGHGEEK